MTEYGDDPTILKIRGESKFEGANEEEKNLNRKTYIKKVSSAILTVIGKHGSAKLKAVGASSVSNAIKAAIIARGEGSKKGLDLVIEPSFDNANFDGNIKTAIVMKVINRSS